MEKRAHTWKKKAYVLSTAIAAADQAKKAVNAVTRAQNAPATADKLHILIKFSPRQKSRGEICN